jgi:hypothetical protein
MRKGVDALLRHLMDLFMKLGVCIQMSEAFVWIKDPFRYVTNKNFLQSVTSKS